MIQRRTCVQQCNSHSIVCYSSCGLEQRFACRSNQAHVGPTLNQQCECVNLIADYSCIVRSERSARCIDIGAGVEQQAHDLDAALRCGTEQRQWIVGEIHSAARDQSRNGRFVILFNCIEKLKVQRVAHLKVGGGALNRRNSIKTITESGIRICRNHCTESQFTISLGFSFQNFFR